MPVATKTERIKVVGHYSGMQAFITVFDGRFTTLRHYQSALFNAGGLINDYLDRVSPGPMITVFQGGESYTIIE